MSGLLMGVGLACSGSAAHFWPARRRALLDHLLHRRVPGLRDPRPVRRVPPRDDEVHRDPGPARAEQHARQGPRARGGPLARDRRPAPRGPADGQGHLHRVRVVTVQLGRRRRLSRLRLLRRGRRAGHRGARRRVRGRQGRRHRVPVAAGRTRRRRRRPRPRTHLGRHGRRRGRHRGPGLPTHQLPAGGPRRMGRHRGHVPTGPVRHRRRARGRAARRRPGTVGHSPVRRRRRPDPPDDRQGRT